MAKTGPDSDIEPSSVARESEAERIQAWRVEVFEKLGFSGPQAILLARSDVDLHRAEHLLASGCAPSTAAAILL